jgi:hypothetical protein
LKYNRPKPDKQLEELAQGNNLGRTDWPSRNFPMPEVRPQPRGKFAQQLRVEALQLNINHECAYINTNEFTEEFASKKMRFGSCRVKHGSPEESVDRQSAVITGLER